MKGVTPSRSMRVSDEVWEAARVRAEDEDGVPVSTVAAELLAEYAAGRLDRPVS